MLLEYHVWVARIPSAKLRTMVARILLGLGVTSVEIKLSP